LADVYESCNSSAYRVDSGDVSDPGSPDLVNRVASCRLDGAFQRTPQGGLRASANLTRTGVLTYRNPDGTTRREYRPADEVFKADSLKTLEDAPVTDLHPSVMVDASNHGTLSKGHARDARQDGKFVAAGVVVQDAALVKAVEAGSRKEISCGYRCRIDMTPGVSPDGEKYDAVQRDISYNHVALLPSGTGRAGREVALRLDAAYEDSTSEREITTVKMIRIDGRDYVIGSEEHLAKLGEDSQKAISAANARADKAETDLKTAVARADKAEGELTAANERADAAEKPAREAARKDLETKAAKVLGAEFKFDGVSDADIRKAVADKALDGDVKTEKTDSNGAARVAAVASTTTSGAGVKPINVPRFAPPAKLAHSR
jgi:hypothetical protein